MRLLKISEPKKKAPCDNIKPYILNGLNNKSLLKITGGGHRHLWLRVQRLALFILRSTSTEFFFPINILIGELEKVLPIQLLQDADKPIKEKGTPHNCSVWTGASL